MFGLALVCGVLSCLVGAIENRSNYLAHAASLTKNNVASHHNISYIDKAENMLRTPNLNINKYYEEHKKKKPKKSPKSTIQKIIKKNRSKILKKFYLTRITAKPTAVPQKVDDLYGQEDKQWRDEVTSTQANQRKRSRKYSPKVAGYHMPFQRLHAMKERRNKRGLSRELFILKDLDEIEFLSKEDGDDVVKAHVKNFW